MREGLLGQAAEALAAAEAEERNFAQASQAASGLGTLRGMSSAASVVSAATSGPPPPRVPKPPQLVFRTPTSVGLRARPFKPSGGERAPKVAKWAVGLAKGTLAVGTKHVSTRTQTVHTDATELSLTQHHGSIQIASSLHFCHTADIHRHRLNALPNARCIIRASPCRMVSAVCLSSWAAARHVLHARRSLL